MPGTIDLLEIDGRKLTDALTGLRVAFAALGLGNPVLHIHPDAGERLLQWGEINNSLVKMFPNGNATEVHAELAGVRLRW